MRSVRMTEPCSYSTEIGIIQNRELVRDDTFSPYGKMQVSRM